MELKLVEVQRAQKAFQKVMNADLPVRVAFRLSRLAKAVDDVFADIEKQRVKLVEKYGEQAENGDGVRVKTENIAKFQQEFAELLAEETVTLKTDKIELEVLEGVKLTPLEMLALEPFLVE